MMSNPQPETTFANVTEQLDHNSPPPSQCYQPAKSSFTNTGSDSSLVAHVDESSVPLLQEAAVPCEHIPTDQSVPLQQPPAVIHQHHLQSGNTNVTVVQHQPRRLYLDPVPPVGDHYFTLSTFLILLCILCCTWYGLFCTIPALYYSILAREADQRGDMTSAHSHARVSLVLNVIAMVVWVAVSGVIGFLVIMSRI